MKTLSSNSRPYYLLFLLPLFLLMLTPAVGFSQCPNMSEFILDGCVLCNPGCTLTATGNTSATGKDCYICDCPGAFPLPPIPCAAVIDLDATAQITVKIDGVNGAIPMKLSGPVTVGRGFPDTASRSIQTEIVSMELVGSTNRGVPCTVRVGHAFGLPATLGSIVSRGPNDFPAVSFFDVFFEIEIGNINPGNPMFTPDPLPVYTIIPNDQNKGKFKIDHNSLNPGCECLDDGGLHGTILKFEIRTDDDFFSRKWDDLMDASEDGYIGIFPNPFSNYTTIVFGAEETVETTLDLYDMSGRHIAILFDGILEAGELQDVELDGSNLNNGLYIAKFTTVTGEVKYEKLILNK